jgi:hypothetical protein
MSALRLLRLLPSTGVVAAIPAAVAVAVARTMHHIA